MTGGLFLIQTLGCKLNQLESEAITDAFLQAGFVELEIRNKELEIETSKSMPSVIIINTCTVTSKADQKARRVIRKALRDYPDSKVIVTGCYAQLDKDDILKLDNKDRLFVIKKDEVLDYINKLNNNINPRKSVKSAKIRGPFIFNPERFTSHTRSFLKIQDGCDNHCTYCRIRLARGQSISLEKEEVLSRLQILEKNHAEVVLTGVNICQYKDLKNFYHEPHKPHEPNLRVAHEQTRSDLHDLLTYLLNNTEKINIRLSSLEPESIDENFAKILSHKRIRPHFHLSVQSCSEKVLERMGRCYNAETVEKAASLLRSVKDDPFLACDIITGFPGETETEFKKTFSVCKKLDLAWIHVFPYSKRPGTPAFLFKDNVHETEVTKRVQLLTDLAKQGKQAYVKRWLGKEVDVLIEDSNRELKQKDNTYCCGTSENYLKVLVKCDGKSIPAPGAVLRCKLVEAGKDDFDAIAI